jgi:GNAT superfamily N-acetyltransferase
MNITYRSNIKLSADQFIDVLKRSTLSERRPVDNRDRIEKMLQHGNIIITAWQGDLLIGVSRALSDFSFCCYLSDLAVDEAFQKQGIGQELIRLTKEAAGDNATLLLLAAPKAANYYPRIGMEQFKECFIIQRKRSS